MFGYFLANGETEAGALRVQLESVALADLVEHVENVFDFIFGYAYARVAYYQFYPAVSIGGNPEIDFAIWGELGRVIEQVDEYLVQPVCVSHYYG